MPKRRGRTVKLSISVDSRDVAFLEKRAEGFDGNVSAAITEMIQMARELEGRQALADWLGDGREELTSETLETIRAEWRGGRRRKRRSTAA